MLKVPVLLITILLFSADVFGQGASVSRMRLKDRIYNIVHIETAPHWQLLSPHSSLIDGEPLLVIPPNLLSVIPGIQRAIVEGYIDNQTLDPISDAPIIDRLLTAEAAWITGKVPTDNSILAIFEMPEGKPPIFRASIRISRTTPEIPILPCEGQMIVRTPVIEASKDEALRFYEKFPLLAGIPGLRIFKGDSIEIKGLYVESPEGTDLASDLYGKVIKWNLLDLGTFVPSGKELIRSGRKIKGPAILIPDHVISEVVQPKLAELHRLRPIPYLYPITLGRSKTIHYYGGAVSDLRRYFIRRMALHRDKREQFDEVPTYFIDPDVYDRQLRILKAGGGDKCLRYLVSPLDLIP